MQSIAKKPNEELAFLQKIVSQHGPDPEDYERIQQYYYNVWMRYHDGEISDAEFADLRSLFGEVYTNPNSLLGHVFTQPHGYPGDYEIIDKLYTQHISPDPLYSKWDSWFHTFTACRAVRNRKTYFKNLLRSTSKHKDKFRVLNLASGPCRDLLEYFETQQPKNFQIDCVDLDKNAIIYASDLLGEHLQYIRFLHQNVFKLKPNEDYDLIWSAGLFDYFDDRTFVRVLSRFLGNLKEGGEMVIGNFHPRNPTRAIMEFSKWSLHHRTENELVALVVKAGVGDYSRIRIEQESEGVNLFMRIKC